MTYEIIRESNKVEVLKHFIRIEATLCECKDKRKEMINWTCLPDPDFIQKVHNFAETRDDENPTLVWTIGIGNNRDRPQKVRRWILANINLDCLYTCGINKKVNSDLDSVKGNLKCFVNEGYATKHCCEFCTSSVPIDEKRMIIGIAHPTDNRDGEIEIVDGCHRVIAMLANGIEDSQAYVAEL